MGTQSLYRGWRVVSRFLSMAGQRGESREGQADPQQIPHRVPPFQPTALMAWISSAPAFCASP